MNEDVRDNPTAIRYFAPVGRLRGTCTLPGDKSISHRALLLSALAGGTTRLHGLGTGADVAATARALVQLGVQLQHRGAQAEVHGGPLTLLRSPLGDLDCGNSGTTLRLLCGLLAPAPGVQATLRGDPSLSKRPMARVAEPLRAMAADIATGPSGRPPVTVQGRALQGMSHRLPVASAQVKTALLLAGLHANGTTSVVEPLPSRDHGERMLVALGAPVQQRGGVWSIEGQAPHLTLLRSPGQLHVPGDPSSAAFLLAAAILHEDGDIRATGVCLNPTRLGAVRVLARMGAELAVEHDAEVAGEPVGTLHARSSTLRSTDMTSDEVPALIDELPILALCAACAVGHSRFHGIGELRVKESDRLAATVALLQALGVTVASGEDWLEIQGLGSARQLRPGGVSDAGLDHRMAMTAAVAGLCSKAGGAGLGVRGWAAVDSSFPAFAEVVAALSAR